MTNDDLLWLLEWYYKQCNGDWEHANGIKIGTLDNPGWYLKISLDETEIENRSFHPVDINRSENDWIYCVVEDGIFNGYGGPFNLPEIISIFRQWTKNSTISNEGFKRKPVQES
jgi:hypothetical protein